LTSDGRRVVKWEQAEFGHFFATVLTLLKKLTYRSEVEFELSLAKSLPQCGLLPRSTLMQVLLNLGFNAAKHAASGKEVFAFCF
jgi:hypothetical protein